MNSKYQNRINRLKATRFGKIVCRLLGEESGQGMLEYVIIATVIAAAVALGVWLFGAQILGMFQSAGDAAEGRHPESVEHVEGLRDDKPNADAIGTDHDDKWTTSGDAQGASKRN